MAVRRNAYHPGVRSVDVGRPTHSEPTTDWISTRGCENCPLLTWDLGSGTPWCRGGPEERAIDIDINAPEVAPDWCPLRAGDITVRLEER